MSAVLKIPPKRSPRTTIYQEVEFDISEFDDEDLIAELERRQVVPPLGGVSINDMFDALNLGQKERALDLLREYLMNVTGRILP